MLLMAASQYSLTSKTLEIYLGGCLGHCENCHNPELKNFVGDPLTQEIYQGVLTKIQADPDLIKNIWILGGEPLDSDHDELFDFLNQLNRDVTVPIWLWTRYELEQIPQKIRYSFLLHNLLCRILQPEQFRFFLQPNIREHPHVFRARSLRQI